MASVRMTIPSMLATLVHGTRRFTVEADDLPGAMHAMFARHPELEVHVLDGAGTVREHVMVFHNDRAVRVLEGAVADGDSVTVLQAVSGG